MHLWAILSDIFREWEMYFSRSRVSKDDVIWCYHYLLGRAPESEVVVQQKLAHNNFRGLVEEFVRSDEFQKRKGEGGVTEADIRWCYQNFAPNVELSPSSVKEKLRLRNLRQVLQEIAASRSSSAHAPMQSKIINPEPGLLISLKKFFGGWFNNRKDFLRAGGVHPSVLIGIPIKNCSAFLENIGRQLLSLDCDRAHVEVAFVVGDSFDDSWPEAQKLCGLLVESGFKKVHLQRLNLGFFLPHSARHLDAVQMPRLRGLAITRQFIVDNFLGDNEYLWWVDADYEEIPSDTLKKLLACKQAFVIPNLRLPNGDLYDFGSKAVGKTLDGLPGDALVELDIASAHAFIHASVFKTASYLGNPAEDRGMDPKFLLGKTTFQEGDVLSIRARAAGVALYAAKHVVITHAMTDGMLPLTLGNRAIPLDHRGGRIRYLYKQYLQREPDNEGFWHYYEGTLSLERIEAALMNSPERAKLRGVTNGK